MKWLIQGSIYGPEMPEVRIRLSNGLNIFRIKPEYSLEQFRNDSLLITDANLSDYGYAFLQKHLKIYSDYLFSLRIDTEKEVEAIKKAHKILNQALFVLSIRNNSRRFLGKIIYVIDVKKKQTRQITNTTVFSTIKSIRKRDIYFAKVFNKYHHHFDDKVVNKCFEQLTKVWEMMFQNENNVFDIPMLLSYFKIIESISNEVSKEWRNNSNKDVENKQFEVINAFINNYDRSKSPRKIISSFRRTGNEIQELNNASLRQQIEFTGEKLNIDKDIIKQADELRHLRNYKLSHAPREDTEIDSSWLTSLDIGKTNKAENICRIFIRSYINYLESNKKTAITEEI